MRIRIEALDQYYDLVHDKEVYDDVAEIFIDLPEGCEIDQGRVNLLGDILMPGYTYSYAVIGSNEEF